MKVRKLGAILLLVGTPVVSFLSAVVRWLFSSGDSQAFRASLVDRTADRRRQVRSHSAESERWRQTQHDTPRDRHYAAARHKFGTRRQFRFFLTFGLHWLFLRPLEHVGLLCVVAIFFHLLLCIGYVSMGQNIVEDTIVTVMWMLLGSGWFLCLPVVGLSMISASWLALLLHQGGRWALENWAQQHQRERWSQHQPEAPAPGTQR